MNKNQEDWDKFIDAKTVKSNIIRAALYLFLYEQLRNSIVEKLKDFYCNGFIDTEFTFSKTYNEKVVNRKINGKQHIFLSSLLWLQEAGALTVVEKEEIMEIREFRNTVAHEIDKILMDSDYTLEESRLQRIFELMRKIELWWISEVEIPTNDSSNLDDADYSGIISGKEIMYNYIKNICDESL